MSPRGELVVMLVLGSVKFSNIITLPETNSSHLKMDGWNTIVSFWDCLFSGAFAVSFRECILQTC